MFFRNPNGQRENQFRGVYDSDAFRNVLHYKHNLPPFPFLIDIELTNICNLRCIFCGQQAMTRPKGYMDWGLFKRIVDECSFYGTPIRMIRWGEPFLHPSIIDFCCYVKEKGLLLHITTNGLALNEEKMTRLVGLEVDSIIFSFQGANKEQYELMRNNNQYNVLVSNILKLIDIRGELEKPYIHISTTLTDETEEEVRHFVDYWINIVDSVGIGKTNLSRLDFHLIKSLDVARRLFKLKEKETIRKVYRQCTEVYQKLSVDWDGKVSCCCSDYDNFLTVGDANKQTLYEIWNNSSELRLYRELLDRCKHRSLALCSTCYHTYEEF